MDTNISAFTYIISLAAVINGLGIVHLLSGFGEFIRSRDRLDIRHYWVFNLWAAFQFLLHVLLWWSMWGVRSVGEINFLAYLYLLTGPIILYLGTSLLIPDRDQETFDLRSQYDVIRRSYFTILASFWLWAFGFWPVVTGTLAPTAPFFIANLAVAVILRVRAGERLHGALALGTYLLIALYIGIYGMQIGAVGEEMMAR